MNIYHQWLPAVQPCISVPSQQILPLGSQFACLLLEPFAQIKEFAPRKHLSAAVLSTPDYSVYNWY